MKKSSMGCFALFLVTALGISLVFNGILLVSSVDTSVSWMDSGTGNFEKSYLSGSGKDQVAVITLYGVISYGIAGEATESMVDDVVAKLQEARNDDRVKAVILRVDSPGGEVTASDVIYHEVVLTEEVKPVVVFMDSMAASGGYYAAVGGTHLMANELSITGSIGVILQTYNLTGLSEKIGLDVLTVKSGGMKDLLNPFRETTPEEVAFVQKLIDETYLRFLSVVSDERGLEAEALKTGVADGRILSGKRALAEGLIDSTGYFDDAIDKALELAGLEEASVVRLDAPKTFSRLFNLLGSAMNRSGRVQVQVGPEALNLQAGKLYYISPHLFGR